MISNDLPASVKFKILLEPLVSNVTVEPPLSDKLQDIHVDTQGVNVPASNPSKRCFIYLRDGDTIVFRDQGLKVPTMVEVNDNATAPITDPTTTSVDAVNDGDAFNPEVQVKSSDVEPEAPAGQGEEDDTETEEDEPEQHSSPHYYDRALAGLEVTPATAPPTEPTIKETPNHHATNSLLLNKEEAPFSTAPDGATNSDEAYANADGSVDDEPIGDADSPTVTAQKKIQARTQSRSSTKERSRGPAGAKLLNTVEDPPSDDVDELEHFAPKSNIRRTHGKRGSRRPTPETGVKRKATTISIGTTSDGNSDVPLPGDVALQEVSVHEEAEVGGDVRLDMAKECAYAAPTSDGINSRGMIEDAAGRSLPSASGKRRLHQDDKYDDVDSEGDGDDDDDDVHMKNKKRKTGHFGATSTSTMIGDDDEDEPSETKEGKTRPYGATSTSTMIGDDGEDEPSKTKRRKTGVSEAVNNAAVVRNRAEEREDTYNVIDTRTVDVMELDNYSNLVDDDEDDDVPLKGKKRKAGIENTTVQHDDEGSEEEVLPPLPKPVSKSKKQRLPKVARTQSQETAEEIAVAQKPKRKPSPQVLINTPTSSAASQSFFLGKPPKILLSKESAVQSNTTLRKWLKDKGAIVVDDLPSKRTNFICVVNEGHSLKTAKVLRSLALKKHVVTDNWLTESKEAGDLLEPDDFVPGILMGSSDHDRSKIFSGKNLYFTNALVNQYKSGWSDIQDLAKESGAGHVDKGGAGKLGGVKGSNNVIFFGSDKGDTDVVNLINDHDRAVYHKDLLTNAIITGELDLDDEEFKLSGDVSTKKKKGGH